MKTILNPYPSCISIPISIFILITLTALQTQLSTSVDPYLVLQLQTSATQQEVFRHYHKLMMKLEGRYNRSRSKSNNNDEINSGGKQGIIKSPINSESDKDKQKKGSKKKGSLTKTQVYKKKMYEQAYKQIMLAHVLNSQQPINSLYDSINKNTNTNTNTNKLNPQKQPTKSQSQYKSRSSQPNPPSPPPSQTPAITLRQPNPNMRTATIIYTILSLLFKLVPFVLIMWCCIKHANNIDLKEGARGVGGGWKRFRESLRARAKDKK